VVDPVAVGGRLLLKTAEGLRKPDHVAASVDRVGYKPWLVRSFGSIEVLDNLQSRRSVAACTAPG
jgi:hypothetical protein